MPFIGQQPLSGVFKSLDTITPDGNTSYSLLYNSAPFYPGQAERLMVSVNGVVQAPGSSFSIDGSTITFSEAVTGADVIDFVIGMGEVGNATVPTDGSVTTTKIASGAVTADKLNSTLDLSGKTISNFATTGIDDNASNTSLVIDSNGYITKPYTPAFHVYAGSYAVGVNAEVDAVSGTRIIHLNNGNHFSNTTLLFTAPIDGLYLMYVDVTRNGIGTSSGYVKLYKNATLISQALNYVPTTYGSAIAMATIQLSANDTVRGTFKDSNNSDTDIHIAYFGGYLIG